MSLPSFEGPLDLLLHLCQKHELDILDIPIGFVTEKYLEYLAVMQFLDLDVASEYLVMAATLAHIKSKMLLPAPPAGQEDESLAEEDDPREALIRRLLEYQKYKQAGLDLAGRGVTANDVFGRGMPMEAAIQTGEPPLAQVPIFSLVEAFQSVLAKSKIKLSHDIVHERITLTDRINELVDLLRVKRRLAFDELFEGLASKFDLVITFLALLEMTKLRMTRLFQPDLNGPIYVEFSAQVEETSESNAPRAAVESEAPEAAPLDESDVIDEDLEDLEELRAAIFAEGATDDDVEAPFVFRPTSDASGDEAAEEPAEAPTVLDAPPAEPVEPAEAPVAPETDEPRAEEPAEEQTVPDDAGEPDSAAITEPERVSASEEPAPAETQDPGAPAPPSDASPSTENEAPADETEAPVDAPPAQASTESDEDPK